MGGKESEGRRARINRGGHGERERGEEDEDIPHHRLQSRTHPIDLKSFR